MSSSRVLPLLRPLLPWICSSLALGYAAYVHYQMRRIAQCAKREQINKNPDIHPARHVVNVDEIDREKYSKKNRVSYCRCWKSKTFPFCDGPGHHCHNKENNDKVGPLVLTWNVEPSEQPIVDTTSSTNANADSTKLTN